MQTHQIHVSGADERICQIRSELFAFSEVLDVFATGRPEVLVVVYAGRPRPGEWLRALRRRGYRTPARGHARWPRPERQSETDVVTIGSSSTWLPSRGRHRRRVQSLARGAGAAGRVPG